MKAFVIFFGGLLIMGFLIGDFMPSHSAVPAVPHVDKAESLRLVGLKYDWRKVGFGDVMEADFTIANQSTHRLKDFEITCTHSAPSGTVIDRNVRTVYEVVAPHSRRTVHNFNMGLIHDQAARSACEVTDVAVAD